MTESNGYRFESSHCDSMIFKALSLWKLVAALKGKSR